MRTLPSSLTMGTMGAAHSLNCTGVKVPSATSLSKTAQFSPSGGMGQVWPYKKMGLVLGSI